MMNERPPTDEVTRRRSTDIHQSNMQEVRDRIAQSQRVQWNVRKASPAGGGFTDRASEFRRLILPRLAGIECSALAEATGLSVGYCFQISEGRRVPNVRHWAAFQLLGLNHQEI